MSHSSSGFRTLLLLFMASAVIAVTDYPSSIDEFSWGFLNEAAKQPLNKNKNIIVSGLSADAVVAMVALGASGQTKEEIVKALFIDDIDAESASIEKTFDDLSKVQGVTLDIANKIYTKPSPDGKLDTVLPTYRSTVKNIFKSDIQQLDFSKNVDAAKIINDWVEEHTNHRIKDLVDPESLSSSTAAILLNAIYFKGSWKKKFDLASTRRVNFTLIDGSLTEVDMMYQEDEFEHCYSEELQAQIVVLPYEKDDVSMVLIIPYEVTGINDVQNKLSNGGINRHLKDMYLNSINVGLPKFRIESKIDVKDVLINLGVKRVFTPSKAELTGVLNGNEQLYVSGAVQKAFIEVNEDGAEAAAVTEIQVTNESLPAPFVADRPFVYIIKSKSTVLFSGLYHGK